MPDNCIDATIFSRIEKLWGQLPDDEAKAHVEFFLQQVVSALELFSAKNYGRPGGTRGYRDTWLKDGLDGRALFVELNAKFHRLRHMVWGEGKPPLRAMDASPYWTSPPPKMQSEAIDMIMYLLFFLRRLGLEQGVAPYDPLQDRDT